MKKKLLWVEGNGNKIRGQNKRGGVDYCKSIFPQEMAGVYQADYLTKANQTVD